MSKQEERAREKKKAGSVETLSVSATSNQSKSKKGKLSTLINFGSLTNMMKRKESVQSVGNATTGHTIHKNYLARKST